MKCSCRCGRSTENPSGVCTICEKFLTLDSDLQKTEGRPRKHHPKGEKSVLSLEDANRPAGISSEDMQGTHEQEEEMAVKSFKKCPECGTMQKSNAVPKCHYCGHVFEKKGRTARKVPKRSAAQRGEASVSNPPGAAGGLSIILDLTAWPRTAQAVMAFGGPEPTAFFLTAFDLEQKLRDCEARLS